MFPLINVKYICAIERSMNLSCHIPYMCARGLKGKLLREGYGKDIMSGRDYFDNKFDCTQIITDNVNS